MWENPEYDVLSGYLEERAKQLGVSNLYLAHLGAMMVFTNAKKVEKFKHGLKVYQYYNKKTIRINIKNFAIKRKDTHL